MAHVERPGVVSSLVGRAFVVVASGVLLGGCTTRTAVLEPAGPAAARIATLWWIMFGLGTVIFAGVIGLLLLTLFRRRDSSGAAPSANGHRWIVGGGIALPVVVLSVIFSLTLWTMSALAAREPALTVRVTGWQWWWKVYYPEQGCSAAGGIRGMG